MNDISRCHEILNQYLKYTALEIEKIASKSMFMTLSIHPENDIKMILAKVLNIFRNEPSMLDTRSPCIIIGDLHGHLLDLLRIIKNHGLPENDKFIFLGDIVDRGEFSIDTCLIVFLLKILHPQNVFIIRGNHEFHSLCSQFGFYDEIQYFYPNSDLYDEFLKTFSYMPLSILVDSHMICVHGGIGPNMYSISQLSSIPKPTDEFTGQIQTSLLWSDPNDSIHNFKDSTRGMGFLFGQDALETFLRGVRRSIIVRGHECISGGVEMSFNGQIVTVFSASNYCGIAGNMAGVLIVRPDQKYEFKRYMPLQYLTRKDVKYNKTKPLGVMPPIRESTSLTKGLIIMPNKTEIVQPKPKCSTQKLDLKKNIVNSLKHKRASGYAETVSFKNSNPI